MFTKILWEVMIFGFYGEKDMFTKNMFTGVTLLISIGTLMLDIILLPLELIALIVYFIINRRNRKC